MQTITVRTRVLQMLLLPYAIQTGTALTHLTILHGSSFEFSFGYVRSEAPMEFANGFHNETTVGVSRVSRHRPGGIWPWRSIAGHSRRWREPLDRVR